MIRVMLCCSAGMSTSMMVQRMQTVAKERGIEAEIWAVPEAQAGAEAPTRPMRFYSGRRSVSFSIRSSPLPEIRRWRSSTWQLTA